MSEMPGDINRNSGNWSGSVLLWEEQALFIGNAADTILHESPAIKICVSLGEDFYLLTDGGRDWEPFASAIIAPGQYHAIDGRGRKMAMLITVPEAEMARPLNHLFDHSGITALSVDAVASIRELFGGLQDLSDADEAVCAQMTTFIADDVGSNESLFIDPRIAKSIEWIRSRREHGISVKEIAAGVDLSESRLSHLFSENVRVPVRRYLLWLRLRDALHLLAGGGSLTETAYEAGFSDSAHLTRTFRTMLGIAPSSLIRESSMRSFLE